MTWESLTREKPSVGLLLFTCTKHTLIMMLRRLERASEKFASENESGFHSSHIWFVWARARRAFGENWKNIIDGTAMEKGKITQFAWNKCTTSWSKNNRGNVSKVGTIIESIGCVVAFYFWRSLSLSLSPLPSPLLLFCRKIIFFSLLTFIFSLRFEQKANTFIWV